MRRYAKVPAPFEEESSSRCRRTAGSSRKSRLLDLIYRARLEGLVVSNGAHDSELAVAAQRRLHAPERHRRTTEELASAFPQSRLGDLLLSLRNVNLLMVVDPGTQKVKWTRTGPFLASTTRISCRTAGSPCSTTGATGPAISGSAAAASSRSIHALRQAMSRSTVRGRASISTRTRWATINRSKTETSSSPNPKGSRVRDCAGWNRRMVMGQPLEGRLHRQDRPGHPIPRPLPGPASEGVL